jgi:restriction system protein
LLAILLTALPLLFVTPSFAANGYLETAAMWQKLDQDAAQYSLFLQNFYAEVESQIGSDKSKLNQEFARRLNIKYPGSKYHSSFGVLAVNNYSLLTFDSSWKVTTIQQTFGSLQKKYDFRNLALQISNGPNSIGIKLDPDRPEKAFYTFVDIPAISVTAQRVWEKKGNKKGIPQPLKDILNDAYAYSLVGRDNMRMDKLAESMVTDEATRQLVLRIADEIYTAQVAPAASAVPPIAKQHPTPPQAKPSPSLFKLIPWYLWLAIIAIAVLKALTSGRQRRPQPKRNTVWDKTGDFSMSERKAAKNSSHSPRQKEPAPVVLSTLQHKVVNEWTPEILSALEWKRFETVCAEYLRLIGFDPKETRIGADGGVDIWIYKEGDDRPFGIVQCKAWNTYKVGIKPVRELYGVMSAEKVANGLFITSGTFTSEAMTFAEGKLITLFSGQEFLSKIKSLTEKDQATLLNIATAGDYRTPTCPQCGIKMTLRQGVDGKRAFWGCIKFPKCRSTLVYKKAEDEVPVPVPDWAY